MIEIYIHSLDPFYFRNITKCQGQQFFTPITKVLLVAQFNEGTKYNQKQ